MHAAPFAEAACIIFRIGNERGPGVARPLSSETPTWFDSSFPGSW